MTGNSAEVRPGLISQTTSSRRECAHLQYLLLFLCSHEPHHETDDDECFSMGLERQECSACHKYPVFELETDDTSDD